MKKPRSPQSEALGRGYHAGDIYSFRTAPITEFSAASFSRYAALKVLGQKQGRIYYVVLDGVFEKPPSLTETAHLPWLTRSRFASRVGPAWHGAPLGWENDLKEFTHVGTVELSAADLDLFVTRDGYGSWSSANSDAEGEWRWRNDRAAFEHEVARSQRARDDRIAAERERYEKRLKSLTWQKLLEERPFSRWVTHPPFPPPEFVAAARDRIRSAVLELQMLGPKPKKSEVRAVLKACVYWFNAKNREFGEVIETEEREDVCTVLEELAFVARHRSLAEEIDGWRDW